MRVVLCMVTDYYSSSPWYGISMNDCLYPAPNLLSKISDILLQFKFKYIATLADIKQGFLNVEIAPEHRDFLRFLWVENPNVEDTNIIVFRFTGVVFGRTSSPFLLNWTIRHHLENFKFKEHSFVLKFLEDLYVDDTTSGCDPVEQILSNRFCRTDSVEQILSNRFCRKDSVEKILSNRFCRTDSVEQILSNRFCRTDSVEQILSNRFCRKDSVEKILSNRFC